MVFAGIYCLITIGLSLLMEICRTDLHRACGRFFGIGAYISGILTVNYGMNPWACMGTVWWLPR